MAFGINCSARKKGSVLTLPLMTGCQTWECRSTYIRRGDCVKHQTNRWKYQPFIPEKPCLCVYAFGGVVVFRVLCALRYFNKMSSLLSRPNNNVIPTLAATSTPIILSI